jgi:ArsR family metal-binding transcriptional regulator
VELAQDISDAMPAMARAIKNGAYNTHVPVLGFRYKELRVIVHTKEIMVKDIENKEQALEVIEYINNIVNSKENSV